MFSFVFMVDLFVGWYGFGLGLKDGFFKYPIVWEVAVTSSCRGLGRRYIVRHIVGVEPSLVVVDCDDVELFNHVGL